jgi:hypothetical protein
MIGFVTRSVIAITVGTLFLIAMLIALAADLLTHRDDLSGATRRSSKTQQQQTHGAWNRTLVAQSQAVPMEEMQS